MQVSMALTRVTASHGSARSVPALLVDNAVLFDTTSSSSSRIGQCIEVCWTRSVDWLLQTHSCAEFHVVVVGVQVALHLLPLRFKTFTNASYRLEVIICSVGEFSRHLVSTAAFVTTRSGEF